MFLALISCSIFNEVGSNVQLLVSNLCNFAQVDLDVDNRLNHDILMARPNVLILIMPRPLSFLVMYLVVLSVTEGQS